MPGNRVNVRLRVKPKPAPPPYVPPPPAYDASAWTWAPPAPTRRINTVNLLMFGVAFALVAGFIWVTAGWKIISDNSSAPQANPNVAANNQNVADGRVSCYQDPCKIHMHDGMVSGDLNGSFPMSDPENEQDVYKFVLSGQYRQVWVSATQYRQYGPAPIGDGVGVHEGALDVLIYDQHFNLLTNCGLTCNYVPVPQGDFFYLLVYATKSLFIGGYDIERGETTMGTANYELNLNVR